MMITEIRGSLKKAKRKESCLATADLTVGRIGRKAPLVPDRSAVDAVHSPEQALGPPKTAQTEVRHLVAIRHIEHVVAVHGMERLKRVPHGISSVRLRVRVCQAKMRVRAPEEAGTCGR